MYTSIIGSFLSSIQALRLYVSSVEPVILKNEDVTDSETIMAMLLHIAKDLKIRNMDTDEITFPQNIPDEIVHEIKKNIQLFWDMLEISEDGKSGRYRSLPKTLKQSYARIEALDKQNEILYSGSLILLVTYFENTIAKIFKEDLQNHPKIMSLDTKMVSYKILEMSNNIEDVREYLIENEVASMMYKSLADWMDYFKKNIKLHLKYVISILPELTEIIARRNIIVHNNSIVNNIYLNLVSEEYRKNINYGDILTVDKEYILKAINMIESTGMAIILEMWISEAAKNEKDIERVLAIIFDEYLIFENWENAKILYEVCLECHKLKAADELVCKINKWQCYKWLGKFDEIKKEIEELDISAFQPRYKLAVLALFDKYEEFFLYFDAQNDIGENELKNWPLFQEIRKSEIYIQRYCKEQK